MPHTPWTLSSELLPLDPKRIVTYDSEFVRERSYYPKLSLAQLHQPHWAKAALFDVQDHDNPALWQALSQHPAPVVMHSGEQDLELMLDHAKALPHVYRDTQVGFALCHPEKTVSYAAMVAHYLGIHLEKSETRSDWLARPLSQRQCDYAADDVGLLSQVYPHLCAELQRLGRLHWWAEDCAQALTRQSQEKAPYHWYKLRGAPQKLRKAHAPAAEALVRLREDIAAAHDLPRRSILSDEQLIDIVLAQPTDFLDLAEHLSEDHPFFANDLAEAQFTDFLKQVPPLRPRTEKVPAAKRNTYQKLLDFVDRRAEELTIASDTLASPRQLKQWLNAEEHEDNPLSHGWRAQILADFKKY